MTGRGDLSREVSQLGSREPPEQLTFGIREMREAQKATDSGLALRRSSRKRTRNGAPEDLDTQSIETESVTGELGSGVKRMRIEPARILTRERRETLDRRLLELKSQLVTPLSLEDVDIGAVKKVLGKFKDGIENVQSFNAIILKSIMKDTSELKIKTIEVKSLIKEKENIAAIEPLFNDESAKEDMLRSVESRLESVIGERDKAERRVKTVAEEIGCTLEQDEEGYLKKGYSKKLHAIARERVEHASAMQAHYETMNTLYSALEEEMRNEALEEEMRNKALENTRNLKSKIIGDGFDKERLDQIRIISEHSRYLFANQTERNLYRKLANAAAGLMLCRDDVDDSEIRKKYLRTYPKLVDADENVKREEAIKAFYDYKEALNDLNIKQRSNDLYQERKRIEQNFGNLLKRDVALQFLGLPR